MGEDSIEKLTCGDCPRMKTHEDSPAYSRYACYVQSSEGEMVQPTDPACHILTTSLWTQSNYMPSELNELLWDIAIRKGKTKSEALQGVLQNVGSEHDLIVEGDSPSMLNWL